MESQPFRSTLELLTAKPAAKWGAMLCSLAASATLLLLAPVAYLAADLLAHQGRAADPLDTGLAATAEWNRDHWAGRPLAYAARSLPFAADSGRWLATLFALGFSLVLLRGLFLNASAYFSCAAAVEVSGRLRRNVYNHSFRLGRWRSTRRSSGRPEN